jgi:hypothetical protein
LSRLYVTSIVKLADRLGVNVPSDLKKWIVFVSTSSQVSFSLKYGHVRTIY